MKKYIDLDGDKFESTALRISQSVGADYELVKQILSFFFQSQVTFLANPSSFEFETKGIHIKSCESFPLRVCDFDLDFMGLEASNISRITLPTIDFSKRDLFEVSVTMVLKDVIPFNVVRLGSLAQNIKNE